ncbi:MAG: triose-phosphate isomerase [Flavobacteriales bacterium]|nr:triose-phosphate isomerase [Flavobacteriales bacterium]
MRTILAGNWKMHTDRAGAVALARAVAIAERAAGVEVLVAPPFPFLEAVVAACSDSAVRVAAQTCHAEAQGAYTGEVSVPMLQSIGVQACIVGHSERRRYDGENDARVAYKVKALLSAGMTAIYCCGEELSEREAGRHHVVVGEQLATALKGLPAEQLGGLVVAYEPVWAIGTGRTATPEQAQEMHGFIREQLVRLLGPAAEPVPVLYGGSCKPDNAAELFALPDVSGGLIGGASLDAGQFLELVRIAARCVAERRGV